MKSHEESDQERITRLEGSLETLRADVGGIKDTLSLMNEKLSTIGRPNWMLVIGALTILVSLGGMAAGTLLYFTKSEITNQITPLAEASRVSEMDRHKLNDTAGKNSERIAEVNQRVMVNEAASTSNFTGVETQDRAIAQFANLRAAHQQQLLGLLWEKAYGQKLPEVIYYPDISLNPHGK